jgi:hypothetical protein
VRHDGLPDPLVDRLKHLVNSMNDPAASAPIVKFNQAADSASLNLTNDSAVLPPFRQQNWSDVGPVGVHHVSLSNSDGVTVQSDGLRLLTGKGCLLLAEEAWPPTASATPSLTSSVDSSTAGQAVALTADRGGFRAGRPERALQVDSPATPFAGGRRGGADVDPPVASAALQRDGGEDELLEHWQRGRSHRTEPFPIPGAAAGATDNTHSGGDTTKQGGQHDEDDRSYRPDIRVSLACRVPESWMSGAADRPGPPNPFPFLPSVRGIKKVLQGGRTR